MPLLTIFTSPKPFTNPHIAVIQRNAIRSWVELGEEVQVVLLGEEEGLSQNAAKLGVTYIPDIERNASGTPLISSMFRTARTVNDSPILACVNADILLLPDFLESAKRVLGSTRQFLMIGQRWDLDVKSELDFSLNWQDRLQQDCAQRGRLHKPTGSDYFLFPRECFTSIPDFAIGRAGWDNWMIYESRTRGWKTIDATADIQVIHQDHDYSHLPGGQPHYHLPETDENIRLAGGRRVIFTLPDANWQLKNGRLVRKVLSWHRFWREVEIFPLIKMKSILLGELVHYILHPKGIISRLRARFGKDSQTEGNQE
jgi:hypothetical protein